MIFRLLVLLACLLPLTVQANLLPGQAGTGQSSKSSSLIDGAASSDDFLKPEQAFKLSIQSRDMQTLLADFEVTPGYYLYRQRISFKLQEGSTSSIAAVELPKGEMKHDPNFGDMEVYHQSFQATVRLQHLGVPPGNVTLLASFQGCSEKGLCYAPIRKTFDIALGSAQTSTAPPAPADSDQIRRLLGGGKLWLIAAGFFGFGLLLSFTPCVFPMIPILSGIIVGHGEHPSRAHAFYLSLAYTLGMAVAYALAGIAAGLSGHLISNALQNPWALGFCAALFVALALSMFGLYELRLPSSLETQVAEASNRIKGGRFFGVFMMGALSALIVSPCVAAPLAGALLYISQTHDVVLGGVALFALALGMGVPLLAVGLSAGALLPKAGAWMNVVRNFFGVLMLGVAIWLVVLINGAFSFWQEYKAEKATEAMRRLLPRFARVRRDGQEERISVQELVPGDVILLAEGEHISADARLVDEAELRVDQSTLSGESHAVRELVEIAFGCVGLDWRSHVREDPALLRPAEVEHLVGDASKARRMLGWVPRVSFRELVEMMVRADVERLRRG